MKFEKLKNIVEIKKGKKLTLVETPDENSVRVLQIDDLRNDTNLKFTNDKTGVFAKEDDILIAWDGANAGTIGYGKAGYIGSTIALLRKKKPDLYSTTFIGIFLQSQYQYLRSKTTGATIPHISRKALDELEVPVISVNTQLHIANVLSKAENLIAQCKESIRLLDEFLKSTFLEMFGDPVRNEKGWEKVCLGEVCRKIGSGSTPRGGKESYHKEGISLIRSLNVHNDEFVYKDLAFIDDKQAYELRNVIIEENDVLLNITGASVARCCIVPKEILPARVNQHVAILRPYKNVLNPLFLSRMFTSENYQSKLVKDAKSKGATREAITKEELELMKVIAPPIELQTQFAQIVEKTEALKTQYQQSLQELENLYGSLSQRAFRGELSV
jgi:type I restriction enzyme S subunit